LGIYPELSGLKESLSRNDYYAPILKYWLYPLAQRLQGRDFHRAMNEAVKFQFLSSDERRDLQLRKVSALIMHANETVQYYKNIFKSAGIEPGDIKTWDDFTNIPVLTKDSLRENARLLFSTRPDSSLYPVPTSGSTGKPLTMMASQRAALRANVSRIRASEWWGIGLGDRQIRTMRMGMTFKRGWRNILNEKIFTPLRHRLMNRLLFSGYSMTPEIMQGLWDSILAFSPKCLFGFPSAFSFLAEFVNQQGYNGREANLTLVVTTGESLHEWQEEIITSTFGCPVANEFGSTEAGVIAYSHPCGALHTMDDGVIVEVIRSNPEDEFGEVVVTNLDNWGFPIIRYNHNDLVRDVEIGHECSLGLGFGLLKGLIGRSQDTIRLASGRVVYCYYFHHLIQYVGGVKKFQFTQKEPDLFELKVIPRDESFGPAQEEFIRDAVRKNLEGSTIIINLVDSIPNDPSGKLRYVISEK